MNILVKTFSSKNLLKICINFSELSFISSAWIVRRFLKDLSEIFMLDLMRFGSWEVGEKLFLTMCHFKYRGGTERLNKVNLSTFTLIYVHLRKFTYINQN